MTDLALIESSAIEQASDPGKFVELACERAKEWLAQALDHGDIDGIVELKSQAEAIRTYTVQKQLGKDAELSAAEIVRRADRGIGLAIRKGQKAGEISSRRTGGPRGDYERNGRVVHVDQVLVKTLVSPTAASGIASGQIMAETYALANASDECFEKALAEAKDEGNLSRSNLVRKVAPKKNGGDNDEPRVAKARRMAAEGYTSRQIGEAIAVKAMSAFKARHGIDVPADAVVGKSRHHDSNRIVNEVVTGADSLTAGLYLIEWDDLDPNQIEDWVDSLSTSLRLLNRFRNQLKEKTQ